MSGEGGPLTGPARTPVEEEVLSRVRPGEEESRHIHDVASRLVAAVDGSGRAEGMVVGSVARDTWISGDRDLDVFLLFDPGLPRAELEREGLSLARAIASRFASGAREKYAEHPYLNATIEGLDVDLVPCYKVSDARGIQSAVDRTPFHTMYVKSRIGPLRDDVLLLKQFAKAGGVYGSDQMTAGFSGYLCELLVLHAGGFTPFVRDAAHWHPGTVITPGEPGTREFTEPFVVVDPVDPGRNVAAAVSLTRMCEMAELCRGYLVIPSMSFFFPPPPGPFTQEDLSREISSRGTALYAISFRTPPYIEDIVVPQLRRTEASVRELLLRNNFPVSRTASMMGPQQSLILVEVLTDRIAPLRRHQGPPVWAKENAEKFFRKYTAPGHPPLLAGPYIEDGCYFVELKRRYPDAGDLLRSPEMLQVGLGKHIRVAFESGWEVHTGTACLVPGFEGFVGDVLRKESPLVRILRGAKGKEEETQ